MLYNLMFYKGLNGVYNISTKKLVVNICSTDVASDTTEYRASITGGSWDKMRY